MSRLLKPASKYGCSYQLRSVGGRSPDKSKMRKLRSLRRSTNLDSWQLNQLRTMKVGGNGSAADFFSKHGGAMLLTESDSKKKYTSRVAELYKEELAKRVREDAAR